METDTGTGSSVQSFLSFLKRKPKQKDDFNQELLQFLSNEAEDSKKQMIQGIMVLSERCAREIMIPRVDIIAIQQDASLKEVITMATEEGHSRVPVYDSTIDQIVGVLYIKELLAFLLDKRRKFDIKKYLHKPFFIPETMPLDELLLEFKKLRQHQAIVVDEYGGVAGLITMEDILEEIVGDINDEFDEQEIPELLKVNKNTFDVDSRMSILDLNDTLDLELPTDEFDTIGGLVFDLFGKIPVKDETVEFGKLTFKIKEIEGTRINRVLIQKTK
jgi:CBS domain containing-hemolysin-like protein